MNPTVPPSLAAANTANVSNNTTQTRADQNDQNKIDIRSDHYAAYSNKKMTPTNKLSSVVTGKTHHLESKPLSEHVIRFYEEDQDQDGSSDDSENFDEQDSDQKLLSHEHQGVDQGNKIPLAVLSNNPFGSHSNSNNSFSSEENKLEVTQSSLSTLGDTLSINDQSLIKKLSDDKSDLLISLEEDEEKNKTLSQLESDQNPSSSITSNSKVVAGSAAIHSSKNSTEALAEPVAAAVRLTRFLDELTASVNKVQLNAQGNNDILINLRSDVLEGTSIHIVANATHIGVSFSTNNAESNSLLNTNLSTLQSHLVALCPTQIVDIKTDFSGVSNSGRDRDQSQGDNTSEQRGREHRDA